MKISTALEKARLELSSKGVSNVKLDSLILLSYALSSSKEYIIFNPDAAIDLEKQNLFFDLVSRRSNREPISHITNKREFFGKEFFVNKDVLDPRPDSESLIELAIENFSDKSEKLNILEVGVGSGCLIITILKNYPLAKAVGIDISHKALEICRKNAAIHQTQDRLELLQSNIFNDLQKNNKFDLIVSNPPYIASKEIADLEPEVRIYEPIIALDGGLDGLDFYRKIASNSEPFLKRNGKIVIEIGFGQKNDIEKIFLENGFKLTDSKTDLSGIVRALFFAKNHE
jgi:release factor glutamine methyltransferase